VDDLWDRYTRLVAAFGAEERGAADLDRLAAHAAALAATTDSPWLRVQALALAAAARAAGGAEMDVATIVDASLPPIDDSALPRLEELLPSGGSLADRLLAHVAATSVPAHALRGAAHRLLTVLRDRALEDLPLPAATGLELVIVERAGQDWQASLEPGRLTLNASAAWTADRIARTISANAYPGSHLVRLLRPPVPEWSPSPQTTVDRGRAAVGREVLLADHELAHELDRIGRDAGLRWDGTLIVAVGRAIDDLAPAVAAAANAAPDHDVRARLVALGMGAEAADALAIRWRDPLARAASVGRAAGPSLVRDWLVGIGQTPGLQRLLSEHLVPTMLREETLGAAG
jgi:hypothetical protein